MKILITAAVAMALAGPAAAAGSEAAAAGGEAAFAEALTADVPQPEIQPETGGTVIRDQTAEIETALNAGTVKCSAADYSGLMLKVLVPGLADLTILNHRNTREAAPCVAAGRCTAQLGPKQILAAGDGTDRIPVRVVLRKLTSLEGEVCHVELVETVTTTIRGQAFFHERRQEVADRAAGDCR